jgi:prepilin-type N-terminal cleavage/methylation domain-containing protein
MAANHPSGPAVMPRPHHGFSLLEVIIATAILVASSMMLLRLLSVGQLHKVRGETRANAHIVCQSLIDQWLIEPSLRRDVDMEPVPNFPDWAYAAELEQTEIPSMVRVRIRVYPTAISQTIAGELPAEQRLAFQLVRWMRSHDAKVPAE